MFSKLGELNGKSDVHVRFILCSLFLFIIIILNFTARLLNPYLRCQNSFPPYTNKFEIENFIYPLYKTGNVNKVANGTETSHLK